MNGPEVVSLGADRIAYRENGAGFPVLMLHSNSASSKMFQPQLESELADRFRLIAMDLPGHGDSSNASDPESTYSLRGFARSVINFLESRQVDNCIIVGSSMGGNIALEVASGSSRVAGILLFGCAPVDRKLACFGNAFHPSDDFGLVFQPNLTREEVFKLAARLVQGEGKAPDYLIEDVDRADGRMRSVVGQAITTGEFTDEVEFVAGSPIPTAVILGENDRVVNIDYLRGLTYGNLWRGEVQVVERASHVPQLQNPEAFNRLLGDFAGEILAGGS